MNPIHPRHKRTYFAPDGRLPHDELVEQLRSTLDDPCVKVVLEAVTGFVMILNEQRQVLAANQELLDAIAREDPSCVIGLRPGEVLNCMHFTEGPDGCGTAKHCRSCGAVLAILASQQSQTVREDVCRASILRDGQLHAIDLKVHSTPLNIKNSRLTALVLHDISSLKRREVLEQTFFHDVMNTVGGLEGWSKRLNESSEVDAAKEIVKLAERLKEEVLSHHALLNAEQGTLKVRNEDCEPANILERLRLVFEEHPVSRAKKLLVTQPGRKVIFRSDGSLLVRVLANMLKNAFEATPKNGTVKLWFEMRDGRPTFLVHNTALIPEPVKPHIFERSFSTHGEPGRGLGTYSMRLYGEQFLKGTVSFTSRASQGTTFCISLPVSANDHECDREEDTKAKSAGTGERELKIPRLLLVDDEENLLRLNESFLSRCGYQVVTCNSGEDALERYAAAPKSFAAVVTDLRMPGMNGIELSKRILNIASVPVLLCTGLYDDMSSKEAASIGITAKLQKPYNLEELARAVERVLRR